MSSLIRGVRNVAVTSYYFNKSDIKTIMFPIVSLWDMFTNATVTDINL